ncbi:MAG: amidohydrolase family protein, partial [Acidobacteria bacterium]|nr:amidohydrolase family protein [Acidobacteriota bacterium]
MIAAFRAAWVLPMISAPIADGGVIVERGRVVDVGPWPAIEAHVAAREQAGVRVARRDAGHAALMPGLVNAHTHLELSWLHGMVPPAASLAAWVAASMRLRRDAPDPTPALVAAIAAARAAGTSVVGDVANGWSSIAPLERSELRAVVFHELLGFDVDPASDVVAAARERALGATGERVSVTLAAHAPYSTSPALLREIAVAVQDLTPCVMSVHVAESADETEFIATGRGTWRVMLDALGRWTPAWQPPGASPVA